MPTPGVPYRVRGRPTSGPNNATMVPTTIGVSRVNSTVSVTGSVTSTITGTVVANPTTSAAFVTNQVTITSSTTVTLIFATGSSLIFREVTNPTSSNASIFIGPVGMTVTTGHFIPGATAFDQAYNSAALYGLSATGSVTVSTIGW